MTLSRVGSVSTWFWLDLDLCGGAVKYYIIQPEVLAIFVRVTVSSRPKWDVNVEKKELCGGDTSKTDGRFFFRWGPSKLQHAELDTKTSSSLGSILCCNTRDTTCTIYLRNRFIATTRRFRTNSEIHNATCSTSLEEHVVQRGEQEDVCFFCHY